MKVLSILKKIALFTLIVGLLPFNYVYADGSTFEQEIYNQYVELKEQGVLADDISFDHWLAFKKQEAELIEEFENSRELHKVYSGDLTKATYQMQPGDVIITNGTSFGGILGHAGIAISSTSILHIAGPGKHPSVISIDSWNNEYLEESGDYTLIYRHSNSTVASQAAQWANRTYRNSNAEYVISTDLFSTNETYCSKLVWQAYYFGPSTPHATFPSLNIVNPYQLPNLIDNLTAVKEF